MTIDEIRRHENADSSNDEILHPELVKKALVYAEKCSEILAIAFEFA